MKLIFFIFCLSITGIIGKDALQNKSLEQSIADGKEVYQDFCMQCHLPNGEGVQNVYPPLAKSDFLINNLVASVVGVKNGMTGEIEVNGTLYDGVMGSMGLDNEEVADVMNYVLNNFGNQSARQIEVEQVSKWLNNYE